MTSSIGLCRSQSCVERIELDPVEIAVGDEQHQIGVANRLLGELAAQFAGRFVDARRVDQDQLGVLEAGLGDFVGRAVLGGNRKDLLAGQRIEQRALARTDFAERRDLDAAVFELGGEFLDVAASPSRCWRAPAGAAANPPTAGAALRSCRAISIGLACGAMSSATTRASKRSVRPAPARDDAAEQIDRAPRRRSTAGAIRPAPRRARLRSRVRPASARRRRRRHGRAQSRAGILARIESRMASRSPAVNWSALFKTT